MAKSNKRLTNEQFVKRLMNYSRHGALMQVFIIEAMSQYAKQVVEGADKADWSHSMITKDVWVSVAKDLLRSMEEQYGTDRP